MKTIIAGTILSLITSFSNYGSNYQGDLISRNKSDTAVKFLKPPLSLTVLQNRPKKGFYYFFANQKPKFDEVLNGVLNQEDKFEKIFSDEKIIKKTLRATDPARLSPALLGTDSRGVINRSKLKSLSKINPSDILIIYRREITTSSEQSFSNDYFQTPELFLRPPKIDFSITILTKGLVYISKQRKILAIPSNKQITSISKSQKDIDIILKKAVKIGLKQPSNSFLLTTISRSSL